MHRQVVIVGGGPAGMMLGFMLKKRGVDCLILERKDRDYVEARVRAGVLEQTTVDILDDLGLGSRMHEIGLPHDGFAMSYDGEQFRVDMAKLTGGSRVMVYGQQEVMKDLFDAAPERDVELVFNAENVAIHDVNSDKPRVTWCEGATEKSVTCDFVVGCDGYHGVSRKTIPSDVLREYEKVYPFGWLGILAEVPPCSHELIYASHENGFALASMRSETRSRYYIQVSLDDTIDDWSDDAVWDELAVRLGPEAAKTMARGPSFEKSIAPLRSFVAEPMRYGNLFLAGDAAHIVPPTGAKGLNLASSDVLYLAQAMDDFYNKGTSEGLEEYSARALARVWKAERFSWWMTMLTHRFPSTTPIERKMQVAEISYLQNSEAAQASLAENYVGLPHR